MRTRVIRRWCDRHGLFLFEAQVFDHWRDFELQRYYPQAVQWQTVKVTPDGNEAMRVAESIAKRTKDQVGSVAIDDLGIEVVAEYGSEEKAA